jgi:hypothetical protein
MLEKSFMTSILGSGSTKPFSFIMLHHSYSNKNMIITAMKVEGNQNHTGQGNSVSITVSTTSLPLCLASLNCVSHLIYCYAEYHYAVCLCDECRSAAECCT